MPESAGKGVKKVIAKIFLTEQFREEARGVSHLVVKVSRGRLLRVEDVEEVADGGELREDERHREVLAKADGELDPRDVMSAIEMIKSIYLKYPGGGAGTSGRAFLHLSSRNWV